MNEQLEKELTNTIKIANDTGKNVLEFVQQQAPEICEQILKFRLYMSCAGIVGCCILTCCSVYFFNLHKKCCDSNKLGDFPWQVFLGIISGFIAITLGITNTVILLKITVAPKIYLIEYFKTLL